MKSSRIKVVYAADVRIKKYNFRMDFSRGLNTFKLNVPSQLIFKMLEKLNSGIEVAALFKISGLTEPEIVLWRKILQDLSAKKIIEIELSVASQRLTLASPNWIDHLDSTSKKKSKVNAEWISSNALIYNRKKGSVVYNPYTQAELCFYDSSLEKLIKLMNINKAYTALILLDDLLKSKSIFRSKVNNVVEDLYIRYVESGMNGHFLPDQPLTKISRRQLQRGNPPKVKKLDLPDFNFRSIVLRRRSIRKPNKNLNSENLVKLLKMTFQETADQSYPQKKRRIYPAAGGFWEIEPVILINDLPGFKNGVYRLNSRLESRLEKIDDLIGNWPYDVIRPRVQILLFADLGMLREKYNQIALKLVYQNVGVLLAYLYLFSSGLKLNACANGFEKSSYFVKNRKIFAGLLQVGEFNVY